MIEVEIGVDKIMGKSKDEKDVFVEKLKNGEIIEFDRKTLILASKSLSRYKIMKKAGVNFVVIPSLAEEEKIKQIFGEVRTEGRAYEYVKMLAYEKAKWLSSRVKNGVIVAADTIAFYKDEILEKPKDENDARRIFNTLSNSVHIALTGVCIIDGEKIDNFVEVSPVKMLEIPVGLQDILVKDKLTYTYAGGYCVDGNLGDRVIVKAEDFNNVMGLPIEKILKKLEEAGYDFSE